jgi:hypothetical protein
VRTKQYRGKRREERGERREERGERKEERGKRRENTTESERGKRREEKLQTPPLTPPLEGRGVAAGIEERGQRNIKK